MANTKSNAGGDLKTPGKIVCEYQKTLKDGKAEAESRRAASLIGMNRSEMARGYKLCSLAKTEETHRFYRDIDNYELFDMQKSTDIIKGRIDDYAKKDDELGKLITAGSKMLNELKDKLLEANNASCAMRNGLQSILGFKDDEIPKELNDVTDLARTLSEESKQAAEAMVTIAGIHTFADLKALKSFGTKLVDVVKELKSVTDESIKKAGEDAKGAQTELTVVIDELNQEEFDCFDATSGLNAYTGTIKFLCEGPCPPIKCVEDICKEVSAGEPAGTNPGQAKQQKYNTADEN